IVYFPADNDLAPYVPMVKGRLRFGSQFNPNVRVVMLSDRNGADDTEVVTIAGGQVTPTEAVFARWGTRELDTADVDVLAWFLRYARESFPAEREIVSIIGHGIALVPEVAWAEIEVRRADVAALASKQTIPPLPKGVEDTPGDVTDRGFLSTVGLGRALAQATDNGAKPFDLLFLDQCFQGNLDTLYELRGAADNFIASPNYAWLAAPYDQYLPLLAPAASAEQIGINIITRYERNLNDHHPNAIFGVRRADLDSIATATSNLGSALHQAVRGGDHAPIANAVVAAQYVDTTQCGRQNLTLGPPDELIGLGSLATNLRREFPAGDRYGVRVAAQNVLDALNSVYKRSRTGVPYIAPGEFWNYDDSITVLAPLPRNSPRGVAWRTSIYTETVPLAATWTPSPTLAISVTASFAYVRDGSWDEFLAEWHTTPLAPTVGQWCHYIPPALVAPAEAEPLALRATQTTSATAQLLWTPSTQEEANAYHILAKGPFDIAWVTREIISPGQTTAQLVGLEPNAAYQFQVVAQDAAGAVLAQSNALTLTLGGGRIYLPLVER
ncbi:MAG: fibronectin type III domain-containing protein, partial [Chloroflexales bacterium]|nr:fibronectin type III domain-containing protein [Chloroflexales bacterium]